MQLIADVTDVVHVVTFILDVIEDFQLVVRI
jgi:hypothetical protein